MEHRARVVSASFAQQEYLKDIVLVLFVELEHGALVRIEDTGPKSYLCKFYNIFTADNGREDFRNIVGRNIIVEENANQYFFKAYEAEKPA